jgi:hypothetical protein
VVTDYSINNKFIVISKTIIAVMWKMVPMCLFWCLWREKNDKNFENRERPLGDILSLFYEPLYLWMAAFISPM